MSAGPSVKLLTTKRGLVAVVWSCMFQLDDVDSSPSLNGVDASIYRNKTGFVLYLALDLLECQSAIKAL